MSDVRSHLPGKPVFSEVEVRCYFHLFSAEEDISDEHGAEVASLDEARSQALRAIQELAREQPGLKSDWEGWGMRIVVDGQVVATMRLSEIAFPPAEQTAQ
ncbi:DUF6894 family protein [Enterovirga aerilata]|uniref:DUF6894 domain-containing protein n=1 Tax=Enterovirga aerilata TaxID=2730920 RepID=A0A849IDE9_9HYPH|nr:hypothetical protein [Enterovirga sp. DB1703]NNM74070.1 hypothetical protein [Enterovirga sp. DB1703]